MPTDQPLSPADLEAMKARCEKAMMSGAIAFWHGTPEEQAEAELQRKVLSDLSDCIAEIDRLRSECGKWKTQAEVANEQFCSIELTQGKVAVVDRADYERLSKYNWCLNNCDGKLYASRWCIKTKKNVFMHRELLGCKKREIVDHRDGNGLNNRRANLRKATTGENIRNSRKRAGCSSKYKGVVWHKGARKWYGQIKKDGKQEFLGSFGTEEDAARAYDARAFELFGEFAHLNFPQAALSTLSRPNP